VAGLAVLGDPRPGWRPDRFGYSLWGRAVAFQFPVVKLLDYAAAEPALEADANPFAVVVLAQLKTQATGHDPEARRAWEVRPVKGLYDRGLAAPDVRRLFRFIDWMMDLPPVLEEQFWHEVERYEQEKHMPYLTSVERRAIEEGRAEGLLEGIEVGLKLKFGAESLPFVAECRQIKNVEVLRAVLAAIGTAATLDDLRGMIPPK
jgi:hypothetical protein